ncbi:MAG: hemolysin III family protein [Solirubrobacterales bacterium]
MPSELTKKVKPKLRGVLHEQAFYISLLAGALLVATATETVRTMVAALIFAVSVSALLGVSALYHRVTWKPTARKWLRRLDHSMIFLLIAGTYTPFALIVLDGKLADTLLVVVWLAALAGSIAELVLADASKWIMAIVCVSLGWVSIIALPDIAEQIGAVGTVLLAAGGVAYTAGAIVYATQKPDPAPATFGYHEVFHLLVVIAIALQYAVVAFWALPSA